jgi:hypothetical protein
MLSRYGLCSQRAARSVWELTGVPLYLILKFLDLSIFHWLQDMCLKVNSHSGGQGIFCLFWNIKAHYLGVVAAFS